MDLLVSNSSSMLKVGYIICMNLEDSFCPFNSDLGILQAMEMCHFIANIREFQNPDPKIVLASFPAHVVDFCGGCLADRRF